MKKKTYPLFESICFIEGRFHLLDLHLERIRASCYNFLQEKFLAEENLLRDLSKLNLSGIEKIRVEYNHASYSIQHSPYILRTINQLHVVHGDHLEYSFKKTNRNELKQLRGNFDEIIIIKENCVTDSSYSNLAFYNGNEWVTPNTPLLPGVKRKHLIQRGILREVRIEVKDIFNFEKISLINAMMDLEEITIFSPSINIHA
jgi:4-amino-4-deoxychorismate lyase